MGPFLLHLYRMKAICFIIFVGLFMITSCGKKEQVKGIIFERKELPNNRLLISYSYAFNDKTYIDSATVSNKVLPLDTINVILNSGVPTKSLPDLLVR